MAIIRSFFLILFTLSFYSCTFIPLNLSSLDNSHRQAIIVKEKFGSKATLTFWQKDQSWKKIYQCNAVVGRNGTAAVGIKKEGDGKTPQGIYEIHRSFGYAPAIDTRLEYTQVNFNDLWVDDIKSRDYNQWVTSTDAVSYEKLKRNDVLYEMAAIIEYNTNPVIKGDGSAIFMHIWRTYYKPTAGCVALSRRDMRRVMTKLDKTHKPVILIEGI